MVLVIKIALAIIFGLAALAKFSGKTKDTFRKAGYGSLFMYAIATAEVLFAAGLFTPFDIAATIGLLAIIMGAVVTLIRQQEPIAKFSMAAVTCILLAVLLALEAYPKLDWLVREIR